MSFFFFFFCKTKAFRLSGFGFAGEKNRAKELFDASLLQFNTIHGRILYIGWKMECGSGGGGGRGWQAVVSRAKAPTIFLLFMRYL